MADRPVSVTLSANITPYEQAMARAAKSMDGLTQSAQKAATESGKLTANAQQWSTIGGPIAAAGAAMLALSANVAKTGGSYNMLQQTSRAALKTLLGSAEAVNAQMDKLDAFASTSPFSKAVFIEAQQQMLGFGIETAKVIPYLSAINEATAAVGGNNQTVAELASILSKISSSAKITAQDLNQLGDRGVNAADIIGEQMGVTAGEIRESITRGTLDAEAALDALTTGMSERFEGASANVKETMGGALDRVTAAWRDLAAEMMSPLISPEGGGLLVDATNSLADLLRWIGRLPPAAKVAVGAMGGLTGAAAAAGGAFLLLLPRIKETRDAWVALNMASRLTVLRGALLPAVGALAAFGAIVGYTAEENRKAAERMQGYTDAILEHGNALNEVSRADAGRHLQETGVLDLAEKFGANLADVTDAALGSADAMDRVTASVIGNRDAMQDSIDANQREIDALQQKYDLSGAENDRLNELILANANLNTEMMERNSNAQRLQAVIEAEAEIVGESTSKAEQLASTQREVGDASEGAAAGAEAHAQAEENRKRVLEDVAEMLDRVVESTQAYAGALLALSGSELAVEDSIASLTKRLEELNKGGEGNQRTLDKQTEAGRANQRVLDSLARSSMSLVETMYDQNYSMGEIADATARAREQWVEGAVAMDEQREEAEALADQLFAIPSAVGTWFRTHGMDDAHRDLELWEAALQGLSEEEQTTFLASLDGASRASVEAALDNLARNRNATISVNAVVGGAGAPLLGRTMYQADGGVVDYYADGGLRESHVAQIAPAGAWRVWAEPETGGEAYIPLAESKRGRSEQILSEVATRFGMQLYRDGGLNTTQGALSGTYAAPVGNSSVTYVDVSSREGLDFLTRTIRDADVVRYATQGVH